MRFSSTAFNNHLNGALGQDFAYRKSYACPCVSPSSGAARANCPLCNAKGRQWGAEVKCRAGMVNQSPQKAVAMFGVWEPGDATLSIPANSAMYGIGWYDRVRSLNSTSPFSMVVMPGLNDKLIGSIVSIDRVFWLNTGGDAVIEGGRAVVGDDGSLAWASGAPPDGVQYSITGTRYDEWFAQKGASSDRNIGAPGLPRKIPVRRFDLFSR